MKHRCNHCKRRITLGETLLIVRECIRTKTGHTRLGTKLYCSKACVANAHE